MDFCTFKRLDLPAQLSYTCQLGVNISKRAEDDCIVVLYQLNNFYVEVYYKKSTFEIIKIISFHSTVLLEPYLKKMNIDSLFNNGALVRKPVE